MKILTIGDRVVKYFEENKRLYLGTVVPWQGDPDSSEGYVTVRWDDGLEEEYERNELSLFVGE